jgi:hypothetical protein
MILITAVDPQVPTMTKNPIRDPVVVLFRARNLETNVIRSERAVSPNPIGGYETWDRPAVYLSREQRRWHASILASL